MVNDQTPGIRTVDGGDQTQLIVRSGSATVDLKGGSGIIADRRDIITGLAQSMYVRWETELNIDVTPLVPSPNGNFPVVINIDGDLEILDSGTSSIPTVSQYNDVIVLAVITMVGGVIANLNVLAFPTYGTASTLYAIMSAVGSLNSSVNPFVIDGSTTFGATSLRLEVSAGEAFAPGGGYFLDPNTPSSIVTTTPTDPLPLIALAIRDSSFSFSATGELDPDNFEDPVLGLIATPNNKYTLQHLFMFPQSKIGVAIYGDEAFNTLQGAKNSVINGLPVISGLTSAIPTANISIQQATTNFNNPGTQFDFLDVIR